MNFQVFIWLVQLCFLVEALFIIWWVIIHYQWLVFVHQFSLEVFHVIVLFGVYFIFYFMQLGIWLKIRGLVGWMWVQYFNTLQDWLSLLRFYCFIGMFQTIIFVLFRLDHRIDRQNGECFQINSENYIFEIHFDKKHLQLLIDLQFTVIFVISRGWSCSQKNKVDRCYHLWNILHQNKIQNKQNKFLHEFWPILWIRRTSHSLETRIIFHVLNHFMTNRFSQTLHSQTSNLLNP